MAPRMVYFSMIYLLWSIFVEASTMFRSVSYGPFSRTSFLFPGTKNSNFCAVNPNFFLCQILVNLKKMMCLTLVSCCFVR